MSKGDKQNQPTPDMFRQTKPCADCPFRKDAKNQYSPEMRAQYASYFLEFPGATFPCHKSVPKDDDRKQWSSWRAGQTLCAGGLILAHRLGMANAVTAWGLREGHYDPDKLEDQDVIEYAEDMEQACDEYTGVSTEQRRETLAMIRRLVQEKK